MSSLFVKLEFFVMVHTYSLNGFNIAIDINSGAVYSLDDCAFDIIEVLGNNFNTSSFDDIYHLFKNKYDKVDLQNTYDEIKQLYDKQLLFSKDEDYSKYFKNKLNSPVKSMCINIAHDCNLRCEYCFASKGNFGGKRELMSIDTAKKAIDFLIKNSENRVNLEVDFFGGEPLMNFDVVRQTIDYARSIEKNFNKNFRFTITTNGLLLDDEKIDYINKEMNNVVLSIDGRKEINDKLRKTVNGLGSYDIILPKFQKLVSTRGDKDYYIRGTFTKNNLDFAKDVIHFADLGFKHISIEPVVSDDKLDYSINENDLEKIYDEYDNLANEMIRRNNSGNGFNFFHFNIDLDHGPCPIKRIKGCGCGNEYVAVTPNGDIYPCHQFVGDEKWIMGNLTDGTFNKDYQKIFADINICSKEQCKNCWAKFYCSGGCVANSKNYMRDMKIPHKLSCDLEKKRVECAIMLKVAMAE